MADVALWLGPYMSIGSQKRHLYKDPNGPGVQANHNKPNKTPHPTTRRPQIPQPFFFSSLADVALRLGPYMSISCQKDVLYKDTVGPYEQANRSRITKKTHKTTKPRRPANSPARFAFRQSKKKRRPDTQRGKGPNKNTHKKNDLPMDTAVLPLCHTQKHARINYPLRHSVKHRNRIIVYTVVSIVENCTWSRAYEIASLSILSDVRTCVEGHNAKDLDCPSSVDKNVAVVVVPSTPPQQGGAGGIGVQEDLQTRCKPSIQPSQETECRAPSFIGENVHT